MCRVRQAYSRRPTVPQDNGVRHMPNYRRNFVPGGTYFFTVVTHERRKLFVNEPVRVLLRTAMQTVRGKFPFTITAMVLLPDHLHCIWTLPEGDAKYPTRWRR